ncbi:MAG TPA: hypothetical protein VGO58_08815 [Chitinophagaceae bacterium]|jgi:hypothetical protein|nr:hypothetical protein [Chitinophagaceae bacterium]
MKQIKVTALFALLLCTGTLFAQQGGSPATGALVAGEKKGWPSAERYNFIRECTGSAKARLTEDAARYYCYCMQERLELKYPTIEEAQKITESDMNSPAFQKNVKECKEGIWTTKDRNDFVSECINAVKEFSEDKAKNYCECMLFKVEQAFPKPEDATQLNAEKLNSPEWKRIAQGCLDF